MPTTSMKRVYVPKFCELCGKEEFEGHVFGQYRERHLRAQTNTRQILCDDCSGFVRPVKAGSLSSWFDEPSPEAVD